MPVLSFGIAWFGYTLLAYGVATVRGCNVTFTSIAWPGKWTGCNPDAPGAGSRTGTGTTPSAAGSNEEKKTGTTPKSITKNANGTYTAQPSGVQP